MSSSTLPTQEVQVTPPDVTSISQSTEPKVSIAVSGPPSSDTFLQKLGNGSLASSSTATTPGSSSSSSSIAVQASPAGPPPPTVSVPASPAGPQPPSVALPTSPAGPPPPRFPGNNAAQESIRANFSNTPGYTIPAGFSYNVFPRVNPPPGAPQQRPMALAGNLSNRISPAALQPPVPGQPIVTRPSFSYNVVSHVNAIPAPGQQFQPTAVPGQAPSRPRGEILPAQASVPSSHSSPSVQPLGSNSNFTRGVTENPPASSQLSYTLAKGQPSTPSFSVGGGSQPSTREQKEALSTASTEGTAQNAPASSSAAQLGQSCTSTSSSSTQVLAASANFNHATSLTPGGPTFPRPPGAPGYPGMLAPNASVTVRPTAPEASSMPQKTVMPSPALPNPASFQTPTMQNIPQQLNHPHPLYPAAAPPQPLWLPPQVGGVQRPPFLPYSGPTPAPFPLPMRSTPPITALHPPGVPVMAAPGVSLSVTVGSVPSSGISTTKTPPTDDNPVHNDAPKKIDADAWTAHKTEEGVIYYYNSVTGESTYEKPANFKVEADKVTAQPTPISWEKLPGSDWALVTTDDGKKYYYDTKNKVSSWQIPQEVADVLKNQENAASVTVSSPSQSADKVPSTTLNTPALQTGGRDATGLRTSGGTVSSSALDLVKKKLQDASAPLSSPPVPVSSVLVGSTTESVKVVESSTQETESSKEKPKDTIGDANLSESSSDSEDTDVGPTKEECIIQFKEMLKERGIAPFSKWEKELPKIVFDPRFKAVPGYALRRSLFEHYVRTRAEEERKEKKAAQKAAIEAFKSLLEEASEDIVIKTDYATFKRKWGKDPRFVALDRKEKEQLLNERVLSLKKAAEEARAVAVSKFMSMLRERRDVTSTTRWSRVKDSLRNDPRYKVVKHEEREALFNEFLLGLKAAEDDAEKAERSKREEQEKLKRREQEMRKRKQREEQEMETLRLKVRRKEAEASFQALLVETIKDPKASWTESKPKLEKDPQGRFTNSGLELADMEKLFREHVKILLERCMNDFRALLNDVITVEASSKVNDSGKSILTSWSEAKPLLKADARYTKLPSRDRESLWRKHADELLRKQKGTSNPTRLDLEGKSKSSPGLHRRR